MMQEDIDKYRAQINEFLIVGQKEQSYDMQHYRLLDLLFKNHDEEQDQFSYSDWAPRDSWLAGNILDIIVYVILQSWGKQYRTVKNIDQLVQNKSQSTKTWL